MEKRFTPEDLNQITRESVEKLRKSDVINLTLRLRDFGIDLYERLNLNSSNSSKPPSSDSPYTKDKSETKEDETEQTGDNPEDQEAEGVLNEDATPTDEVPEDTASETTADSQEKKPKNKPGRQPGSMGFWREVKPEAQIKAHHYPERCIFCLQKLEKPASPYMGFYTYELERRPSGIEIVCTLHYYYDTVCSCGHKNIEKPGEGYTSITEGRTQNIQLKEYTMVGPMLTTFIASLSRQCNMSRKKIQKLLRYWMNFNISTGRICQAIREAGIACYPVVDELVNDLQKADKAHMDETPWYQKGVFCWLWVAINESTAVYRIGSRKKTELVHLITATFVGWLITDGYGAYRSYSKRQRCLAHLIRKAVALTGAVDKDVQKTGEWFLKELRGLIKAMAQGEAGQKECRPILARLKRACNLGSKSDHAKLKALANEILNDWDAVVAFVKNPGLPPTNNDAERALRMAVIFRKITYGTRSSEGSQSYAAFLSVMKTCGLRGVDPWNYIALTIARGRKGLTPIKIA